MKIIQNNTEIDLTNHIKTAEKTLQTNNVYVVNTADYIEHIAAYIAWTKVGGNIFVKSTLLPEHQSKILDEKIKDYPYQNTICFHTSGTTGVPKLVVHSVEQMNQFAIMSTNNMGWDSETKFLNYIPAATSGFWHIVLPPALTHNATIVLGARDNLIENFNEDVNLVILVPALLDMIRINNINLDFSKFKRICCGASQVLKRHAETAFNLGAKEFNHMYGATEIGSPILHRATTHVDEYVEYLEMEDTVATQFKIVDDELYVKGQSLCVNYKEFSHEDEWFKTNDLWEQQGNLIKFAGRSNDIVKINGYQCSLLLIESLIEDKTNLGEALAIPRNSMGSDYIELVYTNKDSKIDKKELATMLEVYLPNRNIPRKYTHVESLPKTSLGKKIRNVL